LIQQTGINELQAKTTLMVYAFIHHWKAHIQETIEPFEEIYRTGLETGDLEAASHAMFFSSFYSLFSGKKLFQVDDLMERNSNAICHLNHEVSRHRHEIYRQIVANLRGNSQNTFSLKGDIYDEQQMFEIHLKANDRTTLCNLYFSKLFICFMFGQYHDAITNGELAEKYLDSVTGAFGVPLINFFNSLSRLAIFVESDVSEQTKIKRKVNTNQKVGSTRPHEPPSQTSSGGSRTKPRFG